ncbi:antitoxin [Luteococcus sp. H138]|uniref:FitA-like ribbon-helix-helix domain-containing protein n=1 Tax=unclassified Luteococcus TaxID=2639923 RepID=UPI00313C2B8A
MTTLYIREVPEAVAETLKTRAAAQGQSLSAYVNAQLATLAARPSNAEVAARLRTRDRSAGVSTQRIVDEVQAARR